MRTPTAFISYSHADERWKDRLVAHLHAADLEDLVEIWDDRKIAVGDDWLPHIEAATDRAAVAVLLITVNFLTSQFIRIQEIPRLLERRQRDGLRLIPLIVQPCAWRTVEWLAKMQCRPERGAPLSKRRKADVDHELSELATEIWGLVRRELWTLRIESDVDSLRHEALENITAILRRLSGDSTLSIRRVMLSSVRLEMNISSGGAKTIKRLIESGQLTELSGFRVLDLVKAAATEEGSSLPPGPDIEIKEARRSTQPRILLLDDSQAWLDTLAEILGNDFDLALTTSAEEACKLAKEEQFALVVLDLKLSGGVTGLEVLSRMRRVTPGLSAIILTGFPDLESSVESDRRGALDYVSKGVVETLTDKIQGILNEHPRPNQV